MFKLKTIIALLNCDSTKINFVSVDHKYAMNCCYLSRRYIFCRISYMNWWRIYFLFKITSFILSVSHWCSAIQGCFHCEGQNPTEFQPSGLVSTGLNWPQPCSWVMNGYAVMCSLWRSRKKRIKGPIKVRLGTWNNEDVKNLSLAGQIKNLYL